MSSPSMDNSSAPNKTMIQKADRYCIRALVCLTLAIAVFSVGIFIDSPVSIIGLSSLTIGILLVIASIVQFALYSHYEKASHS